MEPAESTWIHGRAGSPLPPTLYSPALPDGKGAAGRIREVESMAYHDLVLRDGDMVDGSGGPAFRGEEAA